MAGECDGVPQFKPLPICESPACNEKASSADDQGRMLCWDCGFWGTRIKPQKLLTFGLPLSKGFCSECHGCSETWPIGYGAVLQYARCAPCIEAAGIYCFDIVVLSVPPVTYLGFLGPKRPGPRFMGSASQRLLLGNAGKN